MNWDTNTRNLIVLNVLRAVFVIIFALNRGLLQWLRETRVMNKHFMKGNDAIVHGALLGGATHFFGYPITPASEIAHAAAEYFPKAERVFLQAECEVSSINMLYGAATAGARVMTASSGLGISLMAEGLSYMAGSELPCVVVDIQRAGPGLGNIFPEQGDYNCIVKGGGHGCYKNIVLAPYSVQEMSDFTYRAFEIADKFRMTVVILADAYIGQMMEAIELPKEVKHGKRKDWALYADNKSRKNLITSILMNTELLSGHNLKLQEKYRKVENELVDYDEIEVADAEIIFVAFGVSARICLTAVEELRQRGIKIGMLRPKTLFPFPKKPLRKLADKIEKIIVVELNDGQMADDVELAVERQAPVFRYNWFGGIVPTVEELVEKVKKDL
jgi:2-oxoisovalerate ferredoxin oxidoreductase alpha subunit